MTPSSLSGDPSAVLLCGLQGVELLAEEVAAAGCPPAELAIDFQAEDSWSRRNEPDFPRLLPLLPLEQLPDPELPLRIDTGGGD